LERRLREMEKRVAELEDRLRANSSNSSTAPSSNPLWAPKLKPRKPTGNKPGGQKGHQGHHRQLLPPDQVDEVVDHLPRTCCHCRAPLDQQTPTLRSRHQVHELPPRAVVVTEHRSYARTCASCGKGTTEPIPPAVRKSASGPRLSAALCYLTAFVHGSRRAVEEVAGELLGCRLSLGTVSNREAEMSEALESGYDQVRKRVRDAPARTWTRPGGGVRGGGCGWRRPGPRRCSASTGAATGTHFRTCWGSGCRARCARTATACTTGSRSSAAPSAGRT